MIVLAHLGVDSSRPERCHPDPGTAHFPGALSGGIGAGIADATRRTAPAPGAAGGSDLDWNSTCRHGCWDYVVAVIPSLMFGLGSVAKGRSQSSTLVSSAGQCASLLPIVFVEHRGLEPLTSTLQRWHSTN